MGTGKFKARDFASRSALYAEAKALLRAEIGGRDDARILALPGGATPMPVYEAITANPVKVSGELYVLLTDERHVPENAPESNYGRIHPMFSAIGLPEERVVRVHTELPLEMATAWYDEDLAVLFDFVHSIRLGIFGVGTDGHTCSLFSREDLDTPPGLLAKAAVRAVPPHRVTLTISALARVERAVVWLIGPEKRDIAEKLLVCPAETVAGAALSRCGVVEIWMSP